MMALAAVGALLDEKKTTDQLLLPPQVLLPPAFKVCKAEGKKATAAKDRPSRLVIPAPVVCAGVNPFGEASGRETDVAASDVEAQGEGFCVASRRGVRHAMEDGHGVIADKVGEETALNTQLEN